MDANMGPTDIQFKNVDIMMTFSVPKMQYGILG